MGRWAAPCRAPPRFGKAVKRGPLRPRARRGLDRAPAASVVQVSGGYGIRHQEGHEQWAPRWSERCGGWTGRFTEHGRSQSTSQRNSKLPPSCARSTLR